MIGRRSVGKISKEEKIRKKDAAVLQRQTRSSSSKELRV